ncbi:MAG: lytic transglycosylase domain-containing protein [Telluria sp.]
MKLTVTAAVIALVGAAVYYAWPVAGEPVTAGDDASNNLMDAVDTMTSKINGWPAGSGPYQVAIQTAAVRYGVPIMVGAWLLWKESRFKPEVIDGRQRSRVGAMGIAQFMPATAIDELGSTSAALNPDVAIPGAMRYLAKLYRATGTWQAALAAYNWGIGNVQRKGIAAAPAETVDYFTVILKNAGYGATA